MVDLKAKSRAESMLFQYGTTYLTDYQLPPYSEKNTTFYKKKKKFTEKKPVQSLKYVQTLSEFKTAPPPFDLMIKRKDIIGTHPMMQPKKNDVLNIDTDPEEAIKTRPRLVMTPALAVDDIPDKDERDMLIADIYTSSTARMFRQGVKPSFSVKAPLVEHPAPAKPITLRSLQLPKVPPEWRMETTKWDGKQLRSCSDPDKEFWIEHQSKMKECQACKETSMAKYHRDLQRQRKMNA